MSVFYYTLSKLQVLTAKWGIHPYIIIAGMGGFMLISSFLMILLYKSGMITRLVNKWKKR